MHNLLVFVSKIRFCVEIFIRISQIISSGFGSAWPLVHFRENLAQSSRDEEIINKWKWECLRQHEGYWVDKYYDTTTDIRVCQMLHRDYKVCQRCTAHWSRGCYFCIAGTFRWNSNFTWSSNISSSISGIQNNARVRVRKVKIKTICGQKGTNPTHNEEQVNKDQRVIIYFWH